MRKANAIAPAIPAAGAAIAALAAELGISEAALISGVIGITAVGTGVYLLDSGNQTDFISQGEYDRLWTGDLGSGYPENWSDGYQNWRGPYGNTWGDLSPEEKSEYSSPADYVHEHLASLCVLFPDLFQVGNDGDLEPTPEPDPNTDPEGHAKWVKARNVLIAIAAGTGGVALSDAVGMLADNAAGSIKNLLFSQNGLALTYIDDVVISDVPIRFNYWSGGTYTTSNVTATFTPSNWFLTQKSSSYINIYRPNTDDIQSISLSKINDNGSYRYKFNVSTSQVYILYFNLDNTFNRVVQTNKVPYYIGNDNNSLNAAFSGTYSFDNGIATYNNGAFSGNYTRNVNYGQLTDTPSELSESVLNQNTYNNYINNFTDAGNDETRTVTIPNFGNGTTHPDYYDFINITPNEEVTPVPDDEVMPSPEPNPNPNPNPGTQYQEDFGERVTQLLSQPFDNLFPFCLIGDMHDFMDVIINSSNSSVTRDRKGSIVKAEPQSNINGIDNLTFDLSGFRVDGFEEIVIPLTPLHDLGLQVRGIFTGLFIITLITGTLRFFLTRGGE